MSLFPAEFPPVSCGIKWRPTVVADSGQKENGRSQKRSSLKRQLTACLSATSYNADIAAFNGYLLTNKAQRAAGI
jgi:hypothetical protein